MACGTPVLTSAATSMSEFAVDAALLVDPESEQSIARGLLRILRDEKLRDFLCRRGLERSRQFRWTEIVAKTVSVYEQAMELRR